jgi:hypothetical protein
MAGVFGYGRVYQIDREKGWEIRRRAAVYSTASPSRNRKTYSRAIWRGQFSRIFAEAQLTGSQMAPWFV